MIKDFEYFAPKTVEEALTLLSQYKEESKVIAGGQSLLILMRQGLVAPRYLSDVKGISSLDYMHLNANEGLSFGALTSPWGPQLGPFLQKPIPSGVTLRRSPHSQHRWNWPSRSTMTELGL